MRKTLILLHRWIALAVSLVLLLTAASGSILVFEGAIDRGRHPELWRIEPGAATLPIDTIVARVEAKFPDAKIAAVSIAPVPDRAWTMGVGAANAYVNPYTGAVNGTRSRAMEQASFPRRVHVFHVEFFAGPYGRTFVAIITAIALFLVLTGIILWWPDKLIRVSTTASWKRINFDLHHALGIFAALVLVVITSSAMLIHFDGLASAVKSLDAIPAPPPPVQAAGPADAPRPSFDALAASARGALPGANIMSVSAGGAKSPAVVAMRFPEDHTPGGRSRVFIDHFNGAVLAVVNTRTAGLGTKIDNLKRSLHTGDVMGKPTEAIWLLATLVLLSQVVTGVLMWWNARKGRARA